MTTPPPNASGRPGNRRIAALCGALVVAMVGAAYAAVPLYDLFCRATGFGGTPMVGTSAPGSASDRTVAVRFDSNVSPALNWRFAPETHEITARLGEPQTVMFKVTNAGTAPSTGIATFNVTPELVGGYFVKIACFCFTEQTLKPGETLESAVVFYVDPDMAKDGNTKDIPAVTLSYTYFPSKNGAPVTTAAAAGPKAN
jgi:cytochrome c oxidase assembly protein subunit 11